MSDQHKKRPRSSLLRLSKPLFISSALLVLSLVWGLYDEVYGMRPWKGYQARFEKLYSRYLKSARARRSASSKQQIKASAGISRSSTSDMKAAEQGRRCRRLTKIDEKVNQELVPQILALNEPFQEVRSNIGALTYQIEITTSESKKNSLRAEIPEIKKEVAHGQAAQSPTATPRRCR